MQITGNYKITFNKALSTNYRYKHNYNIQSPVIVHNITSDQYLKNSAAQVTFTAISREIQLEKAAENIFNKSIVFGPKEYKNLSKKELSILREYRKYFEDGDLKNIPDMLYIAELFSKGIHKQYPNGFTLVSIGRSPSFITKYLEFQGEDVKYCPISHISSRELNVTEDFIQAYKKYLDNISLTTDFVEAAKNPIIFTDFVFEGDTIRNFKKLLALPEFNMSNSKKMHFKSIASFVELGLLQRGSSYDQIERTYIKYYKIFDKPPTAKSLYSSIPYIDARSYRMGDEYEEIFNKYYKNGNHFEEEFDAKMMNFILADSQ